MMHGREKSDSAIVAEKPTNKVVSATAEPVEPRAGAKGNASQQSTLRTQCRKCVSQALERIRQVRRHSPKVGAVCGNSARTDLGGGAVSNDRPYRTSQRVFRLLTQLRHPQHRSVLFITLPFQIPSDASRPVAAKSADTR
jgi:hypothetical protein